MPKPILQKGKVECVFVVYSPNHLDERENEQVPAVETEKYEDW
jgi:hypothetical protein